MKISQLDQSNKTNQKFFVEVCAGAGGLSSGFISQKFKPVLLNDSDKNCVETLKLNHPSANICHDRMENINFASYSNIDLLMGGLPCQSFSFAGNRKGLRDKRGNLILKFIEVVGNVTPKVFLIENVKGLMTHNNSLTLKKILDEIAKLNQYKIYCEVLNSNDYNVPQNRHRLFIVGVHTTITKKFKFPKKQNYKPVLRDVLENCPSSDGYAYKKTKYELMKLIPEDGCWTNLPADKQKAYLGKSYYSGGGKRGILKRLSMNKPLLTLLTNPSQKQTERCHPKETRPLQILEYARIQTFSDTYKFSGSKAQIYKQIGNAVPVNLAKALAQEVMRVLS